MRSNPGIYILAREEFEGGLEKKERKRGKKKKKEKSDITHVKKTLKKLKNRKKSKKTGKNFRGGGGRIFLAGQNIYPCLHEILVSSTA